MRRGTTTTLILKVDHIVGNDVTVIIEQKDVIIKKEKNILDGNTIAVTLTQSETLSLKSGLAYIYALGSDWESEKKKIYIKEILYEGVI